MNSEQPQQKTPTIEWNHQLFEIVVIFQKFPIKHTLFRVFFCYRCRFSVFFVTFQKLKVFSCICICVVCMLLLILECFFFFTGCQWWWIQGQFYKLYVSNKRFVTQIHSRWYESPRKQYRSHHIMMMCGKCRMWQAKKQQQQQYRGAKR